MDDLSPAGQAGPESAIQMAKVHRKKVPVAMGKKGACADMTRNPYLCPTMIRKIEIQNFKSIADLTLDLGRVNVFIGENGSGKSNILEAVAMGAAADGGDVSDIILGQKGIRTVPKEVVISNFSKDENILITYGDSNGYANAMHLSFGDNAYNYWKVEDIKSFEKDIDNSINEFIEIKSTAESIKEELGGSIESINKIKLKENIDHIKYEKDYALMLNKIEMQINKLNKIIERANHNNSDLMSHKNKIEIVKYIKTNIFNNFLIYAPENYFLRKFEEDVSVLGSRGEGLFKLLTVTAQESPESILQIKNLLAQLLNWFDDFSFPEDLFSNERRLHIRDRYLKETLHAFDQRSANEGFLYLLFYFTLFVSKYTPKFFAIDNLDNALNPRLCAELMRTLCSLAAEHDKQCLITTHNPAVLDGLNLEDDDQRLFVVSRNLDGHTQIRRVMPTKKIPGVENDMRLSERFIRGFIGGLPTNF